MFSTMTENLKRLKKSRPAHRTVATRLNNEAKTITDRPGENVSEEELIHLEQISTLLTKKQLYLSDLNQIVRNLIDDTDRLDEEIEESEDYDDKIGLHVDLINRFVMYKKTPARTSTPRLATGRLATGQIAKAGIAIFLWRLQVLDVFLRTLQWSSDKQQPDNRKSKVAVSKNISQRRSRKAFDLSPNHRSKFQYSMQHPEEQIRQQTSDFTSQCSHNSFTETGNKWKPKVISRSHGDSQKTHISAQQTWKARGRSGHIFRVPQCKRNCPPKWENVRKFHQREETPNAILIWKKSWKKEHAPVKQSNSSHRQPSTRSLQAAHNFENLILIYPHLWLQRVNVATKTTNFVYAKVSKHFQYRTGLSWSEQKDFASTAYALDIEVNNTMHQLVRVANESTSVFCTWKQIATRGQLQQRQQLQLAARHHKSKQSSSENSKKKTKKNLIAEWRRRRRRWRRSISSHPNRFSWQQPKSNYSRLNIPKQPHHGRCITTTWIEQKKADGRFFEPGVYEVNNSKGSINLIIKTKDEDSISNGATVLAKMTSNLPSHHVNVSGWTKLQELNPANQNFNQSSTDLIIGAGYYEELTFGENRIKEPQKPNTYHLSCFGWLVIGRESQLEKKST